MVLKKSGLQLDLEKAHYNLLTFTDFATGDLSEECMREVNDHLRQTNCRSCKKVILSINPLWKMVDGSSGELEAAS